MDKIFEAYQRSTSSYILKKDLPAENSKAPETHVIKKGIRIEIINYTNKWVIFKADGEVQVHNDETWSVSLKDFKRAV